MDLPKGYSESFFDAGELPIHLIEGPPAGPPMVFLHGATSNALDWMPIMEHLAADWHMFALDLRGHGQSGRPKDISGYHISRNVQDVVAFLRERVRAPAVLVGHSYGALTSMLTGVSGKEYIRAMILEDPPLLLRRPEDDKHDMSYFIRVCQICQSKTTLDQILAELALQNPQASVESLRPWAQSLAWLDPNFALAITQGDYRETVRGVDFTARIQGIACPVLLMQADPSVSDVFPQQDADFFLKNCRNAQLVIFPGAGHNIHDEQLGTFLNVMDDFLLKLP